MEVEDIRANIRSAILHLSAANVAVEKAPDHANACIRTAEERIETAVAALSDREREQQEAQA